jgi:hypothetical protein
LLQGDGVCSNVGVAVMGVSERVREEFWPSRRPAHFDAHCPG